jgi:hypothetical protein
MAYTEYAYGETHQLEGASAGPLPSTSIHISFPPSTDRSNTDV